jgi:transposase
MDLHSNNNVTAIQDEEHRDIVCRRLSNDMETILGFLEPYRSVLDAVAVESTFNWYYVVDGLEDAGYKVRLVNTNKALTFSDLKYAGDRYDARWLCKLQALGILPEGYIMPREERAVRDLLRRRSFLIDKRTSCITSVKTVIARSAGVSVPKSQIEQMTLEEALGLVGDEMVAKSITVMLPIIYEFNKEIAEVERTVLEKAKLRKEFELLHTAPGIGDILALTIMCETGDIARFKTVKNYSSYCRTVESKRVSNGKKKGQGNRKNGNKYLSWAYSEAAFHAPRCDENVKKYLDRKLSSCHSMVAKRAVANKLARACYYVLRNQEPFDSSRFC